MEMCSVEAVQNLQQLRQLVVELGSEEGCPEERPDNLDEIMSRPVTVAPIANLANPLISSFL
uniref:Fibrous sheath-interacting protein 1 n=1 Tax=Elaeophora elaphi TaxID=1147741 RepID=A0A0R3S742_9BILA